MKKYVLTALVAISSLAVSAQTDKGQWLVGGNGSFDHSKQDEVKTSIITFSPNAGYFFINNLAGGLRVSLNRVSNKTEIFDNEIKSTSTATSIAPFVRYYFLPISPKAKLFGDASYGFGQQKNKLEDESEKQKFGTFTISAGPAFFLTPNTALELSVNYKNVKYKDADESTGSIGLAVGFQIHLGGGSKK